MKNFKSFSVLLALTACFWIGCDKEDETPKISDLQVEVAVDPQDALQVEVTSTSKIAESYRIYFDYDNAPEDSEQLSPGESAKHEYPESSETYTIKVVAVAQGYDDGEFTKAHAISFTPGFLIADFENADTGIIYEGRKNTTIETTDNPDNNAHNSSQKVGKITLEGEKYEAIMIYPTKHIDMTDPSQQIVSLDFYQSLATDTPILIRLSTNASSTLTGGGGTISGTGSTVIIEGGEGTPVGEGGLGEGDLPPIGDGGPVFGGGSGSIEVPKREDVEVLHTVSHSGWKRIRLNFAKERRNSEKPEESPQELLATYDRILVFVGYENLASGDFYIDNLRGGVQGVDIPDTDSDGVLDNRDFCPEIEGTLEEKGCPPFNPDNFPPPPGTGSETLSLSVKN